MAVGARAKGYLRPLAWLVPAITLGGIFPGIWIAVRGLLGQLGANPIAEALNELGLLAIVFLVLSLLATPIRTLSGWPWPIRIRRTLGLFSFFYALAHFLCYALLDQGLAIGAIFQDVTQRPFIIVGMLAFLILIPLAITSTAGWTKRLGAKRWKSLHRLAYLAAVLAVVHFVLRVKKDVSEPMTYAAILGAAFLVRALAFVRDRGGKRRTA
jgi:sulfoxide reductase heme-binding subunit YedZ